MTVYIPIYPFIYGIALAFIPASFAVLLELIKSLTKGVQK